MRGGNPAPGKQYIVRKDETVEEIASIAYGDPSKSSLIWGANNLTSNLVKKGDALIIPGEQIYPKITGKSPEQITVVIDNQEIMLKSLRVIRTMDTAADAWSGVMHWNPGENKKIDYATRPYGYPVAHVYIGNEIQISGRLYTVTPKKADDGQFKELVGYSFTADAVDSSVPPPYEEENVTLEQLANRACKALSIKAVFDTGVDTGGAFTRVTATETDTIFSHLSKLASERGLLVSCTPEGNMLFTRAITGGKPVGTLSEDQTVVVEWSATYDGRKRFHSYKCITQGSDSAKILDWNNPNYGAGNKIAPSTITSVDPAVPLSRMLTFRADDTTPGDIADASRWKKNRQLIDALTFPLSVSTWTAPNGELWKVNTLVTVVSQTLGVPRGFTFLIRSVEFILDDSRTAVIHLVPPQAFSKDKDLGEIWTLE